MATPANPIDILDGVISAGITRGLGHLVAENECFDGRLIRIRGRPLLHFGSCSYLGLELDPRLKRAAADAAMRFGAHFSSSRAYVSAPLYAELEELLERVFGAPVVVMATTTLGHLAALPVLCAPGDAALLDHQGHHSLHLACNQVRAQGTAVELVRHGRLDQLEERVAALARRHERVWYVADGVYSMYGDCAPVAELLALAERHPALHLYLDDAHGVSWCGARGRGYVLERAPARHERLVVATTLGKSFGAGGAAVVFPNEEWRRRVRTCGGPLIFAGPVPPPVLGAAVASARIHLSGEVEGLQRRLRRRVHFCNDLLRAHELPLVADTPVPLRFVGTGVPSTSQNLVERLMGDGFFANSGQFPAVPMKRGGVRFALTLHHSLDDVRRFVESLARHLPAVLAAEGTTPDDVRRRFGLAPPAATRPPALRTAPGWVRRSGGAAATPLALRHEREIARVPAALWDRCLGSRGSFTAEGLATLERIFRDSENPGGGWRFHYYWVSDAAGRPLLATFFTEALWKDDMLAPAEVSRLAERRRLADPRLLTSRVFAMGSLLTEGDHLFLDREGDWRGALDLLLAAVTREAETAGARMIALRDLSCDDSELDAFLGRRGYTRLALPESCALEIAWEDDAEFLAQLSAKARRHQRREVLPWERAYEVEVLRAGGRRPDADELAHYHRLYRNVARRNLALNSFELPEHFFAELLRSPAWELVALRLRPEFGGEPGGLPVAVGACFVGPEQYAPLVLGLDDRFVRSRGLYRQCLLQALRRARHHGLRRVLLGMGAALEKRRFGARPQSRALYFQAEDHFHFDALAALTAEAALPSPP